MTEIIPTREDWLAMPVAAVAERVAMHKLAVYVSTDGTQRHYFLTHPETHGQITDYQDYAHATGIAYVNLFDRLYALGVHTVMTASMYPMNFLRDPKLVAQMIAMSQRFLVASPFTELYAKWQVQARLYGNYDIAPIGDSIRDELLALDTQMSQISPGRERLLLLGYCAGSFSDEMIARTMTLAAQLHRPPTTAELRLACYPHGPERLHLVINTGVLRIGGTLPPVLDDGTDLYSLSHLLFDLSELELRHILYDYLFLRRAIPEDNAGYSERDLAELADYFAQNSQYVMGLGRLVGSGIWYPDNHLIPAER